MIPNSKRILSLALTLCMALSLLLTACGNGGDTPAGDNYAPGVTDNTPTGDNATPDTADTSTLTPATEVNETTIEGLAEQLAGYSPEPRTPAADISKYYSEDKKAFNILNYAKDLGFELSCYAADEFETAIKDSVWYNRFYIGKEDDSSGFTTFKSILDEQATFPFRIEYDGNQATYASIGLFSDENEDALFIKLRDEDHPINDGVDERVDRIYSMNSINYSAEKNILILGRSDKIKISINMVT